jgi:hypothetical protein
MADSALPKIKGATIGVNYGFDRIRSLRLVRSGSRVRAFHADCGRQALGA